LIEYGGAMPSTKHAFSVDVEDWYQGIELPLDAWVGKENRVDIGLSKVLELLSEKNVKATFFTLGAVAKSNPKSIRFIAQQGHEIASHTMYHEKIYDLEPTKFLKQERECKAILEDISESKVLGFRAPYFSITNQSLWALDILVELGYTYDSSISPMQTWRYGIAGTEPGIYQLKSGLIEFTPSLGNFCSHSYGVGGAYLRIYPYKLTKAALKKSADNGLPGMFYVHPWELDPNHPRVKVGLKPFITHYSRLGSTVPKLKKLLSDFQFTTVRQVIDLQKAKRPLEILNVGNDA
jgi:polysaccharide deacetylase family protein (PEP-CTERM system associated)